MAKLMIGVTDCSKYDNYANWISVDENVEALRLSYKENNFELIKKCHGILLTGGEDVHPRFYQKPEYLPLCYADDMDERRDEFELSVLEFSQKNRIPVLGICRGLQITNVFFGGTLIPDIPTFGKFNHSKRAGNDTYHSISVDINSVLYEQVNVAGGEINSAHHQSVERVGNGLVANAFSPDGVIEGLDRLNPASQPYLSLVQWHPERMRDQNNLFTKNIKTAFLTAVEQII
ncbi:MAG: gamma-glutamyl-gamma-aminobutyrate hydrolase family protein [Bacteroidetes bacterium]|nr:gamma-glutamyl-gamma-aminobutyrate hydrolase family protein [Bacteroidota bacterium]